MLIWGVKRSLFGPTVQLDIQQDTQQWQGAENPAESVPTTPIHAETTRTPQASSLTKAPALNETSYTHSQRKSSVLWLF